MYMLAAGGDLDEAATRLERAATNDFADVPDDAGWPMAIPLLAETAALVGDRRAAAVLAEIVAPFAADGTTMMTGGVVLGPATRVLALLQTVTGDHDAADASFTAATESADRLESPIWRARTRLDQADAVARSWRGRSRDEVDRRGRRGAR